MLPQLLITLSFAKDRRSQFPQAMIHSISCLLYTSPEKVPALSKETEKAPESKKSTDEQIKIEFADDVPHEDSREPETVEISVPEKYELPEKYRNAEWLKSIDLGEENLWKRDDVPHEGWHCVGVIDLGSPAGICRMCGYQIIRYVHIMEHPSFPRKIGAGCICAGKMERCV